MDIPGVVVDISDKAAEDGAAKLEAEDMERWVGETVAVLDSLQVGLPARAAAARLPGAAAVRLGQPLPGPGPRILPRHRQGRTPHTGWSSVNPMQRWFGRQSCQIFLISSEETLPAV